MVICFRLPTTQTRNNLNFFRFPLTEDLCYLELTVFSSSIWKVLSLILSGLFFSFVLCGLVLYLKDILSFSFIH